MKKFLFVMFVMAGPQVQAMQQNDQVTITNHLNKTVQVAIKPYGNNNCFILAPFAQQPANSIITSWNNGYKETEDELIEEENKEITLSLDEAIFRYSLQSARPDLLELAQWTYSGSPVPSSIQGRWRIKELNTLENIEYFKSLGSYVVRPKNLRDYYEHSQALFERDGFKMAVMVTAGASVVSAVACNDFSRTRAYLAALVTGLLGLGIYLKAETDFKAFRAEPRETINCYVKGAIVGIPAGVVSGYLLNNGIEFWATVFTKTGQVVAEGLKELKN